MLASLSLHAAVFGAVAIAGTFCAVPNQEEREIPIYFEVVEAAVPVAQPLLQTPNEAPQNVPQEDDEIEPVEDVPAIEEHPESDAEVMYVNVPDVVEERPEIAADAENAKLEPEQAATEDEQIPQANEERAKVVSAPIALNRIAPDYPRSARRKGHEGAVTVEVSVAPDGAVLRVEVVRSSGHHELDAAAVAAVEKARFAPAVEDGVSMSGELRLTFEFRLR